uniref:Uncharacterized protein n=1 Tax=Photinus pyralis TaxID=7054 RepID=A0A1Y1K119_PHOPY
MYVFCWVIKNYCSSLSKTDLRKCATCSGAKGNDCITCRNGYDKACSAPYDQPHSSCVKYVDTTSNYTVRRCAYRASYYTNPCDSIPNSKDCSSCDSRSFCNDEQDWEPKCPGE